jgi:hypothetical protein
MQGVITATEVAMWRYVITVLLGVVSVLLTFIIRILKAEGKQVLIRMESLEATQKMFIASLMSLIIALHPEHAREVAQAFRPFLAGGVHGE